LIENVRLDGSDHDQPILFTRFRRHDGTELGLVITRAIARRHDRV
jgi:signal transduction histidine kinase